MEENVAADGIGPDAGQLARLDQVTPPVGGHLCEERMRMIER